jgi:hypothetical protein
MITASKACLDSVYAARDAVDVSADNVDAQGRETTDQQCFGELLPQCNVQIRP